MNRLDVILDQTIEDIFIERLNQKLPKAPYTLIRGALGTGASGPRMGTAVWPEENSLFVIYAGEEATETIRGILNDMRSAHPNNGITAFAAPHTWELCPQEPGVAEE